MTSTDKSSKASYSEDARIAEQASMATNMAYLKAKSNSYTVVVSKNGFIVEERSDGTEVKLCQSKRRRVKAGVPINVLTATSSTVVNGRS